jgi:hypothetical protein
VSENDGGQFSPEPAPDNHYITDNEPSAAHRFPRQPPRRSLVRVAYALDPVAARAFADAAHMRAATVQTVAAAIRFTAYAQRAAGGDDADVVAAVAATRRVIVHALARAVAAELASGGGS